MENVWIGTSGWSYTAWAGTFYPARLSSSRWLDYYVTQFPTVEINATFYRLPTTRMVENWSRGAPRAFDFAVKGSRYITHILRLSRADQGVRVFLERLEPLRPRTAVYLWQLPPSLHKDLPRLENFLERLPKEDRHAVEFRHLSWMADDVFEMLHRHNSAYVWASTYRMPIDFTSTADFVYTRFHGLEGGAAHNYSAMELEPWAAQFSEAARRGKTVFAYFNNDVNARAPFNAKMLMEMVGAPVKH